MPAHRRILLPALVAFALALPAGVALAASGAPSPAPSPAPSDAATTGATTETLAAVAAADRALAAHLARVRHAGAVRRVVRLARARARLAGSRRPEAGYRDRVDGWPTPRLRAHAARLGRAVRELRRTGGAPDVPIPAALRAIARCESGGDPAAVDASGTYRGLFQFDRGTWASVGGTGDPAAASAEEQYRRAAVLYARAGASPWPVCGR